MKEIGFDQPLYVLPFDHRASFETKLFGLEGPPTPEQTAEIARAKEVIYDGFRTAVAAGVPKDKACVLVDEQFGAAILRDCAARGYPFAAPAEKSGARGVRFSSTATASPSTSRPSIRPSARCSFATTPRATAQMNRRQAASLERLSAYLHDQSQSRFLFELLVPPEKAQLDRLGGDRGGLRPRAPPEPDGRDDPGAAARGRRAGRLEGRGARPPGGLREDRRRRARGADATRVGCIVLGRGADDEQVRAWLTTAARVPGFIGFAIGRTDFWEPLVAWRANRITRDDAVARIARRYRKFVDIFEKSAKERSHA